jgi:hypothetical protein
LKKGIFEKVEILEKTTAFLPRNGVLETLTPEKSTKIPDYFRLAGTVTSYFQGRMEAHIFLKIFSFLLNFLIRNANFAHFRRVGPGSEIPFCADFRKKKFAKKILKFLFIGGLFDVIFIG